MPVCNISPGDKKALGKKVGEKLISTYGKKPFYKPAEIKQVMRRESYPLDWDCWAMCLFTSAPDFSSYHQSIGEVCDYASMKAEMLSSLTNGISDSWIDFDLSWLEWPDIDLSSIFDITP